jgi:hypothetical protein
MYGRFTLTQPAYIAAKFGLDNLAPIDQVLGGLDPLPDQDAGARALQPRAPPKLKNNLLRPSWVAMKVNANPSRSSAPSSLDSEMRKSVFAQPRPKEVGRRRLTIRFIADARLHACPALWCMALHPVPISARPRTCEDVKRSPDPSVSSSAYQATAKPEMAMGSGRKGFVLEDDDGMREATETLLSAAEIESAAYASAEAPSRMPCASLATSMYLRFPASNC